MMPLSIGKAWEETVAFVKREGQLLFPVALLFMALPLMIWPYLLPAEWATWKPNKETLELPAVSLSMVLGFVGLTLCSTFGSLALFALSLQPGISVAEALRTAGRRLGTQIAAIFILVVAILMLGLAAMLVAGLLVAVAKGLGAAAGLILTFAFLIGLIFVSVRLTLLNAVVMGRDDGPLACIRAAWDMSKGCFWQLSGFMALFLLVAMIAAGAAEAVFGSVAGMIGGASAAMLVGALASAIVSAVANVYILVMLARLYVQRLPRDLGTVFD